MRPTIRIKPKWEPLSTVEAFSILSDDDQRAVESAARTGDWIGKYDATGFSPENQIWNAIEAAFDAWRAHPNHVVPHRVRDIFLRMENVVNPRPKTLRQATPDERSRILQPTGAR